MEYYFSLNTEAGWLLKINLFRVEPFLKSKNKLGIINHSHQWIILNFTKIEWATSVFPFHFLVYFLFIYFYLLYIIQLLIFIVIIAIIRQVSYAEINKWVVGLFHCKFIQLDTKIMYFCLYLSKHINLYIRILILISIRIILLIITIIINNTNNK